jgi:alcohol dehydrogenase class IV
MEYPVGGAVHVSHGAGNGLLLPYVMQYNLTNQIMPFAEIGTTLGKAVGLPASKGFDDSVELSVMAVERLRGDIGIPTRLRDIGVTEDMLPGFAAKAFGIKRLMRVNPRMPQSADEILGIYRAAW